jgi:hypothetical protein
MQKGNKTVTDSLKAFKFDYLELGNDGVLDRLIVRMIDKIRRKRQKGTKT